MSTTRGPGLPGPRDYRPLVPSGQGAWSDPVAPEDRPRLEARARRVAQRGRWLPVAAPLVMLLVMGVFFLAVSSRGRWSALAVTALPMAVFFMFSTVIVWSVVRRR